MQFATVEFVVLFGVIAAPVLILLAIFMAIVGQRPGPEQRGDLITSCVICAVVVALELPGVLRNDLFGSFGDIIQTASLGFASIALIVGVLSYACIPVARRT
jgi:hypothetical protein